MKNPFTIIFSSSKSVFRQSRAYWLLFSLFFILALVLFVLVPSWSVPGNDIAFQVSLFSFGDWILFAVLALLIGLLLTMQVFIFRRARNAAIKSKSLGRAAVGATGASAGVLAGVFTTAACSWCVATVFGFLGTGAVLFIAKNQLWAVFAAISIMIISLYFTSRSVVRECKDCNINKNL